MIHLSSSSGLFENKKIYRVSDSPISPADKRSEKIVVIYQHSSGKLPDALQQMLDKLLQACKFNATETAYINAEFDAEVSFGTIQEKYPAEVILIFGEFGLEKNLIKLRKNIPHVINKIKILPAESLSKLDGNDKEKKALWMGLQKMLALS